MQTDVGRYLLVGASTNILNFGLFFGFRALAGLSVFNASLAAYGVAITYSFIIQNLFVFSQNDRSLKSKKVASYVAVIAVSAPIQAQAAAFVAGLSGVESLGWIVGALVAAGLNYVMLKRFVFKFSGSN